MSPEILTPCVLKHGEIPNQITVSMHVAVILKKYSFGCNILKSILICSMDLTVSKLFLKGM